MFAAVNFAVVTVGLLRVPATLLHHIHRVIPALQVSAAEFSLVVLFVAGTLQRLLVFHFVVCQLGWGIVWLVRHDSGQNLRHGPPAGSQCPETRAPGRVIVTAHCNPALPVAWGSRDATTHPTKSGWTAVAHQLRPAIP